ncbi:hypothetical protein SEA_SAMISTI12_81 [Streptomyces phage Samisti12]|uniref:Uncharacterized protein n=7 Tax=Samistivirus TaxID=2560220 RepID=A0A223FZX5_9CAUD|nr:hypothetical protein FDI38_gp184 [Streptomyces phage Peebs]YP_009611519.1 hypothetical protein FDI39_gp183 [Streptomyces phage Samisti12]YP_010101502.1 hypothetical protein KNU49_gp186 [Streptomyces phage EGole]ASR76512.1 hypothetical protein SEA_SUSHI23_80 [Streptomyces phage Sushi23]QAX95817.1 hypothetical protein SEA_TEUTSCH_81 [Streptomyces phage Teutsch]QGH78271.1 hypothetical protein SEA_TRIBUTE_79 [Streptomyces phage Tribute]QRI46074.1 hypothetical protein SEA_CROSS_81 [Streptomyces
MDEAIRPEDILRLLLIANGPVTISAEEMDRALGDATHYQVAVSYEPFKEEFTIHLENDD